LKDLETHGDSEDDTIVTRRVTVRKEKQVRQAQQVSMTTEAIVTRRVSVRQETQVRQEQQISLTNEVAVSSITPELQLVPYNDDSSEDVKLSLPKVVSPPPKVGKLSMPVDVSPPPTDTKSCSPKAVSHQLAAPQSVLQAILGKNMD
jgi:hypothetical protein